jgi:hypothetical protein
MTSTTRKVLAGVAVATLAAAGAAAVITYRRGQRPDAEARAHLDELDVRLNEVEEPGSSSSPARLGRILDGLRRSQDISAERLRRWITGVRQGTLSPEQAAVAESDFNALEREADQGGV